MAMAAPDRRPRLLLTGYGPFPGAPVNPTGRIVRAIVSSRSGDRLGLDVVPHVFATTWAALNGIEALIDQVAPDVCLHLGLAGRAREIRVETSAKNFAAPYFADAEGRSPAVGAIDGEGPPRRPATLPIDTIRDRIVALGLPTRLSTDAGRYLCNATLYRSAAHCAKRGIPAGFLHLPNTRDGGAPRPLRPDHAPRPVFTHADLTRAVEATLGVIAARLG